MVEEVIWSPISRVPFLRWSLLLFWMIATLCCNAWCELHCVFVSGIDRDHEGAFSNIFHRAPMVGGAACTIVGSWGDAKNQINAIQKVPGHKDILVIQAGHGGVGGLVRCNKGFDNPHTILDILRTCSSSVTDTKILALIDSCYSADLLQLKLQSDFAQQLKSLENLCVLTSSQFGQTTSRGFERMLGSGQEVDTELFQHIVNDSEFLGDHLPLESSGVVSRVGEGEKLSLAETFDLISKSSKAIPVLFPESCQNQSVGFSEKLARDHARQSACEHFNKIFQFAHGESSSEFFQAVEKGDLDRVRTLLFSNSDSVNEKRKDGWTPLAVATSRGDLLMVKTLVQSGAEFESLGPHGIPAIIIAREHGFLEIEKFLVEKVEQRDRDFATLNQLIDDLSSNHAEQLKEVNLKLESLPLSALEVRGFDFKRPPDIAHPFSFREILEAHPETKAHLNEKNRRESFSKIKGALSDVDFADLLQVAKFLDPMQAKDIEKKLNPSILDVTQLSSFSEARKKVQQQSVSPRVLEILQEASIRALKANTQSTPLQSLGPYAYFRRSRATYEKLARQWEDFFKLGDAFKFYFKTAEEFWGSTKTLLQVYQELKAYNPLIVAVSGKDRSSVQSQLKNNSRDVNLQDVEGSSPLNITASQGNLEIVQDLVEIGHANLELPNHYGWTPLFTAAAGGHSNIVKYLLEKNANFSARNLVGETVLMAAVASGDLKTLENLLQTQASLQDKDSSGQTVFDHARKRAEVHPSVYSSVLSTLMQAQFKIMKLGGSFKSPKKY